MKITLFKKRELALLTGMLPDLAASVECTALSISLPCAPLKCPVQSPSEPSTAATSKPANLGESAILKRVEGLLGKSTPQILDFLPQSLLFLNPLQKVCVSNAFQ